MKRLVVSLLFSGTVALMFAIPATPQEPENKRPTKPLIDANFL